MSTFVYRVCESLLSISTFCRVEPSEIPLLVPLGHPPLLRHLSLLYESLYSLFSIPSYYGNGILSCVCCCRAPRVSVAFAFLYAVRSYREMVAGAKTLVRRESESAACMGNSPEGESGWFPPPPFSFFLPSPCQYQH